MGDSKANSLGVMVYIWETGSQVCSTYHWMSPLKGSQEGEAKAGGRGGSPGGRGVTGRCAVQLSPSSSFDL